MVSKTPDDKRLIPSPKKIESFKALPDAVYALHKASLNSEAPKLRRAEVAPFGVKICTLEPGGIRTNWARRAGQNAPALLPDYEASVGSILKMLRSLERRSEGDPRKIADVMLRLANSDEALGVDAERRVQQAEAARAREADKWRHLTFSTIFEDGRFDSRLYMAKSGINS